MAYATIVFHKWGCRLIYRYICPNRQTHAQSNPRASAHACRGLNIYSYTHTRVVFRGSKKAAHTGIERVWGVQFAEMKLNASNRCDVLLH